MSNPFGPSAAGTPAGNPGDRSDQANPAIARYRKPRIHVIAGIASALAGLAILVYSSQFFLFHPMTPTDEYVGGRMWIVGSWLLGGGVTLTIARPWVAALVGFVSPALTFAMAMLLYFALILLAPFFAQVTTTYTVGSGLMPLCGETIATNNGYIRNENPLYLARRRGG